MSMMSSSSSKPSAPPSGAQRRPVHHPPRRPARHRCRRRPSTGPGIDPAEVGQVVGGCVSQVGEQAFNVGRTAWLTAGLPLSVAATTVDTQCGSSQQATNLATALVGSGRRRRGRRLRRRGDEPGADRLERRKDLGLGIPIPKSYFPQYEMTSQFEGAERIADKWGITRDRHRRLRPPLPAERRPGVGRGPLRRTQIVPVDAPDLDEEGKPTGSTHTVARDEGLRETTPREARPSSSRSPGPTACTPPARRRRSPTAPPPCSMMTAERAESSGLRPGPRRRHLPGRRRPGADAHRPDRRHPAACSSAPVSPSTTSTSSRSTRRSPRSCSPGPGGRRRPRRR